MIRRIVAAASIAFAAAAVPLVGPATFAVAAPGDTYISNPPGQPVGSEFLRRPGRPRQQPLREGRFCACRRRRVGREHERLPHLHVPQPVIGCRWQRRPQWEQADILSWEPPARRFDLVSAHFMPLPGPAREALHRRLAGAVRPGGRLLVVGHHPSDLETSVGRPNVPDMLFTPEQVAAVLDAAEWEILVSAAPSREARDPPEGRPVTVHDTVLHAVRRA